MVIFISKTTCRYGRFLSQENNDQSEIINIILLSSGGLIHLHCPRSRIINTWPDSVTYILITRSVCVRYLNKGWPDPRLKHT